MHMDVGRALRSVFKMRGVAHAGFAQLQLGELEPGIAGIKSSPSPPKDLEDARRGDWYLKSASVQGFSVPSDFYGDFLPETSSADPRGGYIHWWARADSNCRPPACQAGALTT